MPPRGPGSPGGAARLISPSGPGGRLVVMPNGVMSGAYIAEIATLPPISGLPQSVAGFVGRAGAGPIGAASPPFDRLIDFEAIYGLPDPGDAGHLWHAARAFFLQGGEHLHVVRVADAADCPAGLAALAAAGDISLVAAPGVWASADEAAGIATALIAHAEATRRFALIDGLGHQSVDAIRAWRRRFDSRDAALYHPWLAMADPGGGEVLLPPSASVAGLMARVDRERGMWKAPANELLRSASPEVDLSQAELDLLNPEGINCLRSSVGRGARVWGARTASDDPEWMHVNWRRWSGWIARSIAEGTNWAAFQENDEALWALVRAAAANFLTHCWQAGGLAGASAREAFFVRCDRTTMAQDDLDAGRLVCEIGLALARPAEFVILRLGHATAG